MVTDVSPGWAVGARATSWDARNPSHVAGVLLTLVDHAVEHEPESAVHPTSTTTLQDA